jgi:hypothetical protein
MALSVQDFVILARTPPEGSFENLLGIRDRIRRCPLPPGTRLPGRGTRTQKAEPGRSQPGEEHPTCDTGQSNLAGQIHQLPE